jgi:hypothetical protein
MPYALCPMPYALCPMPYALCPMPYALCPMPYALFKSRSSDRLKMAIFPHGDFVILPSIPAVLAGAIFIDRLYGCKWLEYFLFSNFNIFLFLGIFRKS